MLHFAYGSNLSQKFLRQFCPTFVFQMKAELPNFRITFPFFSQKRQGGISSILPAPGEIVHGVLYDISEREIQELDIAESVNQGSYIREAYLVLGEDRRWHSADLYRVAKPTGPYAPARSYVELMLEGAEGHNLDSNYIKELKWLLASLG